MNVKYCVTVSDDKADKYTVNLYAVEETKAAMTSPFARGFTEMSASAAAKKETEVSMTTQTEANMSVTTSDGAMSLSMTSQHATSTFPSKQGQWTFVTTQLSPTSQQNDSTTHESLVVIAGNSVSLHCTSSVDVTFQWTYWSPGSRQSLLIYNGNRFDRGFQRAASMRVSSCGTRNCTLTAGNFRLGDTEAFACFGGNVKKYWSFTILGKYMHMKQTSVIMTNHIYLLTRY